MEVNLLAIAMNILGYGNRPKGPIFFKKGGFESYELGLVVGCDAKKPRGATTPSAMPGALTVNCGKSEPQSMTSIDVTKFVGSTLLGMMERNKPSTVGIYLPAGLDLFGAARGATRAILRPGLRKTAVSEDYYAGPQTITLVYGGTNETDATDLARGAEVGRYENFQCWLGQLPPNVLNPTTFGKLIVDIFAVMTRLNPDTLCLAHSPNDSEYQRMELLRAVGRASAVKPAVRAMVVHPPSGPTADKRAYVGKGLTFDSGGLSLKTGGHMREMHTDMMGAAAVVAAALYYMHHPDELKFTTVFVVGLAENVISSDGYRVEDIYTAYNGSTVRVLNTDAEGRLVLADTVAWTCEQFSQVQEVIVNATLTGHALSVAGDKMGTLMVRGNPPSFVEMVRCLGDQVGDPVQPLLLTDLHGSLMRDTVADYKNLSEQPDGRMGTQTAAAFVSFFVPKGVRFIHHDMAWAATDKGDPDSGRAAGLPRNAGFALARALLSREQVGGDGVIVL